MNANALWAGNDYAYVEGRGRGQNYAPNATRVRVLRVVKRAVSYGAQRDSSFAEVQFIDSDGNIKMDWTGDKPLVREIRARDIMMRWGEYENEREHRKAERERLAKEEDERVAQEQEARTRIMDALEAKGIERLMVTTVGTTYVTLNRAMLESWLGLEGE